MVVEQWTVRFVWLDYWDIKWQKSKGLMSAAITTFQSAILDFKDQVMSGISWLLNLTFGGRGGGDYSKFSILKTEKFNVWAQIECTTGQIEFSLVP